MTQTPLWKSDIEIDENLAQTLIQEQFPNLGIFDIHAFGQGWDNRAFLVNDQWVFRFPCRKLAGELMIEEIKILPLIHGHCPIATPKLEFIGQPTASYPWHFNGYQKLFGHTACSLPLTDHERGQNAEILAEFLRTLHSEPSLELATQCQLQGDIRGKASPSVRVPLTKSLLSSLTQRGLIDPSNNFNAFLDHCLSLNPGQSRALVHGDLYTRHLLVADDAEVTGIIDWGDVHIGHIATDLGLVYCFLPVAYHDDFWATYGSVGEEIKQLAQMRALYISAMLIDYGDAEQDAHLVREGLWCLEQLSTTI